MNLKKTLFFTKNSYKTVSIYFIIGFSVALTSYAWLMLPILTGDGHEYILMLESFFNHLTPDIRLSDLESLSELSKVYSIDYYDYNGVYSALIDAMKTDTLKGGEHASIGIFKSYTGQYFGYHFWFYSLISLPAKFLLAIFNQNEFKAFQLTNAFFVIGAVSYALLVSKQSHLTRIVLTIFYLLGCNFFYLQWTHPEIYTAAVLFIASCAFLDKRYKLSVLMASLAALQNNSAVMFVGVVLLSVLVENKMFLVENWRKKSLILEFIQLSLLGCISFLPYAFYYYHFGTFSLIVQIGAIDRSLIGLSRLSSHLFDLNQGMIIGFPGIMIAAGILALFRLFNPLIIKKGNLFNRSDFLLLATLLMILPVLGHVHWNSGQIVVARYAFWTAMPLMVWVAVNLQILTRITRLLMVIFVSLLQLFPHFSFPTGNLMTEGSSLKPHAKWVLENFPGWYKPDPKIFIARIPTSLSHKDLVRSYHEGNPVIYKNKKGVITQILIGKDGIYQTSEKVCGKDQLLVNMKTGLLAEDSRIHSKQKNWGYLIGPFLCSGITPHTILDFRGYDNNSLSYQAGGWTQPDPQGILGTWTEGVEARLLIPVQPFIKEQDNKNGRIVLKAKVFPLVTESHTRQVAEVVVNGQVLDQWVFHFPPTLEQRQATIPIELIAKNQSQPLEIIFRIKNPVSPKSVGLNEDPRLLSLNFEAIELLYLSNQN